MNEYQLDLNNTPENLTMQKDIEFIKECCFLEHDGMKSLNDWNLHRNSYFSMIAKFKKSFKVVEIGVRSGKNAYRIDNLIKPKELVLVDPWDMIVSEKQSHNEENKRCEKNVRMHFKEKSYVKIFKDYSINVAKEFKDNYFDFVYIDGDHSIEGVLSDLNSWHKKVRLGGFIGGHDYWGKGVKQAVDSWLELNKEWKIVYIPPKNLWGIGSSDGHYDFLLAKEKNE